LKLKGRYQILHATGNLVAVILTYEGTIKAFIDPIHCLDGEAGLHGLIVATAIHIYHVIAFQPLPYLEWLHHILMIGIVVPITFQYARGTIVDYCLFFINGLPGGIDYFMLFLIKNNWCERTTEKRVNAALNTWCRTPFGTIGGYILFINVCYKYDQMSSGEMIAGLTARAPHRPSARLCFIYSLAAWPSSSGL